MRVLHVVPTYLPATRYGGPIYSVHGLCKSLVARGHDVHVFTTNVDGEFNSDVLINTVVDIDGVKVWYFPSDRLRRLYYSPQMKRELEARIEEFDLVHLHSVFLWSTWAAARAAQAAGVPYVLSPRGMLVIDLVQRKSRWIKTAWLRLIEKKNIEHAAGLHVTSKTEAKALNGFTFNFPSVFTLANGVEKPQDWSHDKLSEDIEKAVSGGDYILYFGRVNWEKGLDRLLRAWVDVPDWRLVIAGNDEENYLSALKKVADESDVSDRVLFIPRSISGADKEALLQSASLLVLPSYSENFGNVVPEAMVRGVPVVVTEEVGAKDVVKASGGGIVVSAEKLGVSINELLMGVDGRKDMGLEGKEWVEANLTWDIVATQMERRYFDVVGRRSK